MSKILNQKNNHQDTKTLKNIYYKNIDKYRLDRIQNINIVKSFKLQGKFYRN